MQPAPMHQPAMIEILNSMRAANSGAVYKFTPTPGTMAASMMKQQGTPPPEVVSNNSSEQDRMT